MNFVLYLFVKSTILLGRNNRCLKNNYSQSELVCKRFYRIIPGSQVVTIKFFRNIFLFDYKSDFCVWILVIGE